MQKNCLGYPVELVDDVFGESPRLAEILRTVTKSEHPRVLIVADMNVVHRTDRLGLKIGHYVQANGIELAGDPVVIQGGEKIKTDNLQSALKICSSILEAKIGNQDCVLAMGGGSLLDVAGYAAAQVRGGVKIVRLPTTPAAMMDAAFATYAAVDSQNVKDALRVPSVPAAVLIDLSFARTVLDGVWRAGIGTATRLACAMDAKLLKRIVQLAPGWRERSEEALDEIVRAVVALLLKKGMSSFALWSALRLEAMSGYKLPYGHAVSIGVFLECAYAAEKGRIKDKDREMVCDILANCGALEAMNHSQHILSQREGVLCGIDAWWLSTDERTIVSLAGLGKSMEDEPDRVAYGKILKDYLAIASNGVPSVDSAGEA